MTQEQFNELSRREQFALGLERGRKFLSGLPKRGLTTLEKSRREFKRGIKAQPKDVTILSNALYESQRVARKMMKERDAMESEMREMEQQYDATVAKLQKEIQDLNAEIYHLRNPNKGGLLLEILMVTNY